MSGYRRFEEVPTRTARFNAKLVRTTSVNKRREIPMHHIFRNNEGNEEILIASALAQLAILYPEDTTTIRAIETETHEDTN